MSHYRYFPIKLEDPNIQQIQAVIVDPAAKPRCSLDETLFAVCLHEGDHNNYEFLAIYQEYNEKGFQELMASPEWQPEVWNPKG
jgi:hypothetical protein